MDAIIVDDRSRVACRELQVGVHPLGYTGFLQHLIESLSALWDIRGVLSKHDVAGHNLRGRHARWLVEGEIPRLDGIDHADWLVDEGAFAFFGVVLLRSQDLSSLYGIVVENHGTEIDLRACVFNLLAHF